jgi:hypothetical protein
MRCAVCTLVIIISLLSCVPPLQPILVVHIPVESVVNPMDIPPVDSSHYQVILEGQGTVDLTYIVGRNEVSNDPVLSTKTIHLPAVHSFLFYDVALLRIHAPSQSMPMRITIRNTRHSESLSCNVRAHEPVANVTIDTDLSIVIHDETW